MGPYTTVGVGHVCACCVGESYFLVLAGDPGLARVGVVAAACANVQPRVRPDLTAARWNLTHHSKMAAGTFCA